MNTVLNAAQVSLRHVIEPSDRSVSTGDENAAQGLTHRGARQVGTHLDELRHLVRGQSRDAVLEHVRLFVLDLFFLDHAGAGSKTL